MKYKKKKDKAKRQKYKANIQKYKSKIQNTKSTHPDKEIDHESNVECEVDLLRRVLIIRDAVLDLDIS